MREEDIVGSGFAITGYTVHPSLGGDPALARLRDRLRTRGLRLMFDFVPNHTALDHPWVEAHPEYSVAETERTSRGRRKTTPASSGGRTPGSGLRPGPVHSGLAGYLQLDYGDAATQEAMLEELLKISRQCDGVRCDMAMLVLPDVFERTWGRRAPLFWPRVLQLVREGVPSFRFMAEVYWDLEWTMIQQGFATRTTSGSTTASLTPRATGARALPGRARL